ncbi:MAG: hypothetical protein J3R72DRAFT_487485 [Linnemannia gamsii]|nr:MAG: hypothetical protein J3R72DRAFT_487485 [Linnemannia gamsii]
MLLLPLLPCLTTLKLTILNILVGPLQMWRIFQDCPLLEALCITDASCGLENLPGPWIVTEPNPGNTLHVAKPSLALKSLVLYGMSFKQHTLHHFVVYTPHLTELKVVCAKILDNRSFNFARFNQHIRNQRLRLEYFHFSTFNVPHDGVTSDLCPSPHQLTIGFCDFTLAILKSLRPQVNTITTLELFNRESRHVDRSFIVSLDYPLHEYLCSSPHLLHLRALHCDYPVEYMDLHGRIGNLLAHPDFSFHRSKQHRPTPGLPGIWACRKLRTLHIRIITPEKSLRVEKPYPEMARVAFGYIARVCPELRDLALGNDSGRPISRQPPLDLQLQGGFCLLGRLKHLERIEVGRFSNYSTLTPRNFEWMHEFGRSKEKKVERQEYLEAMWKGLGQWSHILESPGILASTIATNRNHGTDQGHFNWRRVGPKLREELKYLGWPIEVQEFFDELDKPVKDGDVGAWIISQLRLSSPLEHTLTVHLSWRHFKCVGSGTEFCNRLSGAASPSSSGTILLSPFNSQAGTAAAELFTTPPAAIQMRPAPMISSEFVL